MFSQVKDGGVTASLRHAIGPLVEGEWVIAYEQDDPSLCAWARVRRFDSDRKRALLEVDGSTLREMHDAPSAEPAVLAEQLRAELAPA